MTEEPKIGRNRTRRAPNNGHGRPKGARNRTSQDVREAVAMIASHNVGDFETWLHQIRDPARRCDVFLKVLAFNLPQLQRVDASLHTAKTIGEMNEAELRALLGEPPDEAAGEQADALKTQPAGPGEPPRN